MDESEKKRGSKRKAKVEALGERCMASTSSGVYPGFNMFQASTGYHGIL